MPTLGASSSIFQLAVGVNAVLPILISDFESVRDQVIESILRNIKEFKPEFNVKANERQEFVTFCLRASGGLKIMIILTRLTLLLSASVSAGSLAMLCWSSIQPGCVISLRQFFWFVGIALVVAPIFYILRNGVLKAIYAQMATKSLIDEKSVLVFTES
jgi:hypothetical protein